jgi:hypothetical protein
MADRVRDQLVSRPSLPCAGRPAVGVHLELTAEAKAPRGTMTRSSTESGSSIVNPTWCGCGRPFGPIEAISIRAWVSEWAMPE